MSPSDQPQQGANPPTREDIERVRQIVQKDGPWSYAELVQMIGFLEGPSLDQLSPPMQAQVSDLLQALSALLYPLLQQHITTGLQRIATLLQKFSASPRKRRGTQEAE
jgi:hypothetical protein